MTPGNQERAIRSQQALAAYSAYGAYTNLVDFLADAMHWCRFSGRCFQGALDTALMHFDAETISDDIPDDINSTATSERNRL